MPLKFAASIVAAALLTALPLIPAGAQEQSRPELSDMSDAEREALRTEVRAYLLEHPEVLMEAIRILEARRDAAAEQKDADAIASNRQELFNNPDSWVAGNPEGNITLVEFSDYRCGFCKRAHPEIKELLERDPNIKLVVKEYPILGPDSVVAGRVATAALDLDPAKYGALNDALMSHEGQLDEAAIYRVAASVGYDIAALKERAASPEVEARVSDTYALAQRLGLEGTPSFVVGKRIIRGYLPADEMLTVVAEERAAMN